MLYCILAYIERWNKYMKNVLLIGDSIRQGYDKAVQKTLEGQANVFFPSENCQFAAHVLRFFHNYLGDLKGEEIDVIHWNAGLWDNLRMFEEDPQTPLDVYGYYIERLCVRMKKLCPNAKFIFATSTSVISEKMHVYFKDFKRYNEDVECYNQLAVSIVQKHGFAVNDLYKISTSLPESAHSDPTHYYTPEGTKAFADAVLKHIAAALELDEIPEYKEELYTDKPVGV